MSFFRSQSSCLLAGLDVLFENDGVVNMVGGPHTGTSYSLPGHVIVSVPPLSASLAGRSREIRELVVVAEGRSEYFDGAGRHSPIRLFTATRVLACPRRPLPIPTHDTSRNKGGRIQFAIPFDLRVPGWLPATHLAAVTITAYGIVVHAVLALTESATPSFVSDVTSSQALNVGDPSPSYSRTNRHSIFFLGQSTRPNSIAKLPSNIAPLKSVSKFIPFTINRHRFPSAIHGSSYTAPDKHFSLLPKAYDANPIQCVISVPEWVDVNAVDQPIKVTLRIRARRPLRHDLKIFHPPVDWHTLVQTGRMPLLGFEASETDTCHCYRAPAEKEDEDEVLTHIMELGMEVEEVERFSSTSTASFLSSYPIPTEQPTPGSSENRLISPRTHHAAIGFMERRPKPIRGSHSRRCLLDNGVQRNFVFPDGGLGLGERWRKVTAALPISTDFGKDSGTRPQSETDSPFLRIRHSLKIRLVCRGRSPSNQDTVLTLMTNIRFGTSPSTLPRSHRNGNSSLPAYIQVFHENGEARECDPLPIYIMTDSSSDEAPEASGAFHESRSQGSPQPSTTIIPTSDLSTDPIVISSDDESLVDRMSFDEGSERDEGGSFRDEGGVIESETELPPPKEPGGTVTEASGSLLIYPSEQ